MGAVATNISTNSMEDEKKKAEAVKAADENSAAKHKTTPSNEAAVIIIKGIEKGKLKIFVGGDSEIGVCYGSSGKISDSH
ncbi:MAG: hypothetical protein JW817_07265 [Clostridiales bacterium]|nr:hypothetical protein [Clostridiales bacterium]